MAKITGPGPVFAYEWLMASRRWQAYAMRSLAVLLLLGVMTPVWYAWPARAHEHGVVSGERAERTCTAIRQRAAAGIGRSLDAVSGSWFVIPLDGRVLGIAMHVLASTPR